MADRIGIHFYAAFPIMSILHFLFRPTCMVKALFLNSGPSKTVLELNGEHEMSHPLIDNAKVELEKAQSQLDAALRAWDSSVSELWRTSVALTQAQKRVTHAHELLREALDVTGEPQKD